MKAMVITDFGSPDVFAKREVDKPIPSQDQVLVKVCATSINPADIGLRQGLFGPRVKLPAILGFDVSGVVDAIGENVKDFQVGDEVFYAIPHEDIGNGGANAEYNVVDKSSLVAKPRNLSHLEAASIPVAGGTAWAALVSRANIKVGETVLIHGGGGGVGSFAIQIAKAAGAYVYTTCGSYDFEIVKSIGADKVIDYRQENFIDIMMRETKGRGIDVTFSTVMGDVLAKSLLVTKTDGRAVTVTGVQGDFNSAIFKNITVHFVHLDHAAFKLKRLKDLIERGQIKPMISMSFGLQQIAQAHKTFEAGGEGVYGKVVIESK